MAVGYGSERSYTSEGGGGGIHYDPNDISNARPFYDPITGQAGFIMPDGTMLGSRPAPFYDSNNPGGRPSNYNPSQYNDAQRRMYGEDFSNKDFLRDAVNDVGNTVSPGSAPGGGGGGGLPLALKKLLPLAAFAPAARNAFGGNNGSGMNTQIPPELQQLLQMSLQRMTSQDPLFRSINAQAMAGLPTAYQRS